MLGARLSSARESDTIASVSPKMIDTIISKNKRGANWFITCSSPRGNQKTKVRVSFIGADLICSSQIKFNLLSRKF